jgi:hypothetical protein
LKALPLFGGDYMNETPHHHSLKKSSISGGGKAKLIPIKISLLHDQLMARETRKAN